MARTTIDLDPLVLRTLRSRARAGGTTLSTLVSELLAGALARTPAEAAGLDWRSEAMGARVDLRDKEAVRRALDTR